MSRLFVPNLLFEEQLMRAPIKPGALARVNALAPVMGLLADRADDLVLTASDAVPSHLPEILSSVRFSTIEQCLRLKHRSLILHPWGHSHDVRHIADRLNADYSSPEMDVVRTINGRQFLAPFDRIVPLEGIDADLLRDCTNNTLPTVMRKHDDTGDGHLLQQSSINDHGSVFHSSRPFSSMCSSLAEVQLRLEQLIQTTGPDWVIKAQVSHAARNRIPGRGCLLSDAHRGWLRKQFDRGLIVAVEPWVQRIAECGLQFSVLHESAMQGGEVSVSCQHQRIDPSELAHQREVSGFTEISRRIQLDGTTELINSDQGSYIGSMVLPPSRACVRHPVWECAVEHGYRIVSTAAQLGYFGPVGIDCMVFTDRSGRKFLRLCHDINGRMTMGRIAMTLSELLKPNEFGFWAHFSAKLVKEGSFCFAKTLPASVRLVPTSPLLIGNTSPDVLTALFVSNDVQDLISVRHQISNAS